MTNVTIVMSGIRLYKNDVDQSFVTLLLVGIRKSYDIK